MASIVTEHTLHKIFVVLLFITLVVSFYFFITTIILQNNTHRTIFTAWQFPMLFAIFIDVIYTK